MTNDFTKKVDAFLKNVWGKRAENLPTPEIDWNKPARPEDMRFLLKIYPFLQIMSSSPEFPESITPKFIRAKSGWIIHDYGDAMSSSPGKDLFGPGSPDEISVPIEEMEEGGEEGGGTIIQRSYDTAEAMIILAIQKGWPGVEIIAGTQFMQWAAWMVAQDQNIPFAGYGPTEEDEKKRKRILELRTQMELQPEVKPGRLR